MRTKNIVSIFLLLLLCGVTPRLNAAGSGATAAFCGSEPIAMNIVIAMLESELKNHADRLTNPPEISRLLCPEGAPRGAFVVAGAT